MSDELEGILEGRKKDQAEFDAAFDEYFDVSKARLPGLHDESLREGLRRSVLDSARMLVATEAFGFGNGTIVSPGLQKSNQVASKLIASLSGVARASEG